jgi:hypothetical protein
MEIDPTDFENEIADFGKWFQEYGPYTWVDVDDAEIAKINPSLIWSLLSLNDCDYISNCFEEDDECYGFYVSTKPYAADKGTIFVTTNVNVPCEANDDCDPDCQNCGGLGYTKIDIEELSIDSAS